MKIPEPIHEHTTATAIVKMYDKKPQDNRAHLGASEIGKECRRAIWYSFRWATKKKFEGRMLRLFDTGFREEVRFIEELKAIGAEVHTHDEDGKQISFAALGGHFAGSCDGVARGLPEAPKTWAILEFKTHSSKSFAALAKSGVQIAKPEHYAQMNMYMGWAELERALYLAANKDTDELHSEWIYFNPELFDALMKKAQQIIEASVPLEKISNDPAWYQCKFCDHQGVCHQTVVPQKNCRTCAFSTPLDDGTWKCSYYKRPLPLSEQRVGCRSHLYIPNLISFAEAVDTGPDFVVYETLGREHFANIMEGADTKEFNANETPAFTSKELSGANAVVILNPAIREVKQWDAKITEVEIK